MNIDLLRDQCTSKCSDLVSGGELAEEIRGGQWRKTHHVACRSQWQDDRCSGQVSASLDRQVDETRTNHTENSTDEEETGVERT